jgi:REP element-mobilizing transposase RayT
LEKFKNKYRISSTRLKNWNYGNNGAYFITICTANRTHYFGNIKNGILQLNDTGILAKKYWGEIPEHFPFIELGNFVIMSNHIHGILIIDNQENNANLDINLNANLNPVQTRLIASPQPPQSPQPPEPPKSPESPKSSPKKGGITGNKNPMFHKNISRIIRWHKGRCTFEIRKINSNFGWQSSFHDHVIRNGLSFDRIQNYIEKNPLNWEKDTFKK